MKTKIHTFNAQTIKKAAEILSAGGVICFPTETVYALAADATNNQAVERVYTIKGRDKDKPLSLLMKDINQIQHICDVSPAAHALLHTYAPGPITLVLSLKTASISPLVTSNHTIGVRIPRHKQALALLEALPFPLVGTSANLSGTGNTIQADDVASSLGRNVDYILQDTLTQGAGIASTVVDLTHDEPVILRHGSISEGDIRHTLRSYQ